MEETKMKYGWKRDAVDPRDLLYRKIAAPRTEPLPDHVDLREKCSPVENQGQLGSCTANALVAALEFLEILNGQAYVDLSRLFVYYNERAMEGSVNEDSGAQIRDGVKSLVQLGVCPESEWPYDVGRFTQKPTDAAYALAKDHVVTSYHRLLNIEEMLGCLADGFPFVFGFTVFKTFESDAVRETGVVPMPMHGERNLGGHAVTAVGYDRDSRRFIVRNSWGTGWGQRGYFTMPFEYVERYGSDFWTIRK